MITDLGLDDTADALSAGPELIVVVRPELMQSGEVIRGLKELQDLLDALLLGIMGLLG